jgi:hypothetical protein
MQAAIRSQLPPTGSSNSSRGLAAPRRLRAQPGDLGEPAGDEGEPQLAVEFPEPVGGGVGDVAEPRLAGDQLALALAQPPGGASAEQDAAGGEQGRERDHAQHDGALDRARGCADLLGELAQMHPQRRVQPGDTGVQRGPQGRGGPAVGARQPGVGEHPGVLQRRDQPVGAGPGRVRVRQQRGVAQRPVHPRRRRGVGPCEPGIDQAAHRVPALEQRLVEDHLGQPERLGHLQRRAERLVILVLTGLDVALKGVDRFLLRLGVAAFALEVGAADVDQVNPGHPGRQDGELHGDEHPDEPGQLGLRARKHIGAAKYG